MFRTGDKRKERGKSVGLANHHTIKGTFKDHLVVWVEDFFKIIHGPSKAESILDEIDRQYNNF